jgi:diguanylate cyclase (GGDEF)-like protein
MTAIPRNTDSDNMTLDDLAPANPRQSNSNATDAPATTTARGMFSTDEFLTTLASLPGVVLYQRVVTPDERIYYSYISEGARDIFGVHAEEILSDPDALFSTHGSDYKSKFRERLLSASKSLSMWDVEASLVTRDGRKKYTHAIARPARTADGSVVWTGIILDETRTREAVVECLSQGFLLYDSDDRLILRNSHYLKLYPSMSDVAVPGALYRDIVRAEAASVENAPAAQERIERHREPRRVFELQLADKQWVMVNEHRTGDGNTVVLYTDISDIKQREREISYLAHYDSLTGLANRSTFLAKVEEASARHRRWNEAFNVFMMDLDRFKNVNDTLGHPAGDVLLNETARRLKSILRETDVLARLGGDEFAIIQTGETDQEDGAVDLAHKIIMAVSEPYEIVGNKVQVGVSIGIAFAPDHGIDANDLLKKADLALYRAKSGGRNDYRIFDATMGQTADARQKLEAELREALALDQLELHYQPIVDFKTHELCGMEALVRWRHPQRGLIFPGQFIPIAEETGLINKIGEWLLERACTEAAAWPKPIKVAVNLSPVQLANSNLLDVVLCALVESGLPPERLELEITETALFKNDVDCLAVMRRLKNLGVSIALDDFGTGYSSLAQLTMFPFDKIKIDKSFTQNLGSRPECAAIVAAVITLTQKLGITTTAEGIETLQQFQDLTLAGVNSAQGYLLDRPTPAAELDFNRPYSDRLVERDAAAPTGEDPALSLQVA